MSDSTGPAVRAVRGRWLFPVDRPPIRDGVLVLEGDRIAAVGSHSSQGSSFDGPIEDLGNVAILPGLVNAHTHLEFSGLRTPFPPGATFADWIRQVVAYRRAEAVDPAQVVAAVEAGLAESQAAGVRTLGEIATPGWPREPFDRTSLECTVFAELLGLGSARIETNLALAREHVAKAAGARWRAGLSPHAPYTVHCELFAKAIELAVRERLPVEFHLAETREELELLSAGTGPLRKLLDDFGVWEPGAIAANSRPMDYLRPMAGLQRALVIHGNYLADDEIAWLAGHRGTMSVVYCPRTHQHFGHTAHPLERLLAAGARVALGTDSRASNPDLNLLEEIRTVARRHPAVSPAQALHLGTLAGAEALGIEAQAGSLTRGKRADWIAVPLPGHEAADPHELLFAAPT